MLTRISPDESATVLQAALHQGLFTQDDTVVIFYDLARLRARIQEVSFHFPATALHTCAIKANPLLRILQYINRLGMGLEAASYSELLLAQKAGVEAKRIVFDSPAKTTSELAFALEAGLHLNIDNFEELDRVAALVARAPSSTPPFRIGVRLNPQVGVGRIPMTGVAGSDSKFGILLEAQKERLLAAYLQYPWLRGVHVHIGSQGCGMELLLRGMEKVYSWLEGSVNPQRGDNPVVVFDIGGGLPVAYGDADPVVEMAAYAREIGQRCPHLFQGPYRLITEFGRYYHANTAWTVSRIEYVKQDEGSSTAIIHVGADMFLRACYQPEFWRHDLAVIDPEGNVKTKNRQPYNIAGPLCFAGDIVARQRDLPQMVAGDYLLLQDTGAYTFSMWSRYNSRPFPAIFGYEIIDDLPIFQSIKQRETSEEILRFWGA